MELVQTTKEALIFRMSDGAARPLLHAPAHEEAARPIEIFTAARAELMKLEDARSLILNSKHLTDAGKADRLAQLEPQRAQAENAFVAAQRALDEHAKTVDLAMEKAVAPPAIARDDHLAIAQDREIRDWARAATGEAQAELLAQVAQGGPVAAAILRSPVGVPRVLVDAAREATHAAAMASEAGQQALRLQEGVSWAQQQLQTFAPYVAAAPKARVERPAA